MTEQIQPTTVELEALKLAKATYSFMSNSGDNPWSPSDIDKMDAPDVKEFREVISSCRFFYRRDPIASTVINKTIDIGINDLILNKNDLTENEFRVFLAMKDKLVDYAENLAMEFLLSGLVIPEIKFAASTKEELKELGIKKYDSLILPESMWIRDPATIKINQTILSDKPSYYIEIPSELIYFITSEGTYPDGTKDEGLYRTLLAYYPGFVQLVRDGQKEILLDVEEGLVLRRKVVTDSPYPTPYLYPAIEPLKHKRNLRRMDYSIASRVISGIQLFKLGSDEFPITEDDQDQFDALKTQMFWRNTSERDVERIFQLFANHTLNIEWIFPPTEALLNQEKFKNVNEDILTALGFPRILIIGESERSQTSDPSYATASPIKTMESMRRKISKILRYVVIETAKRNNFRSFPLIYFRPLQLAEYATFMNSILKLYESGNLSRTSYAELLGYNWDDEIEKKKVEEKEMKESGLPEFAPTPNSRTPQNTTQNNQNKAEPEENEQE